MEKFLIKRFSFDLEVIEFHKDFLQKNNFQKPKINYLKLYRFLINAVNFLKDIDPDFLETIGQKMYEDIVSLMKFQKEWEKKKLTYYKYFQEYLNTIPDYKQKINKLKNLKSKMEQLQKVIKTTEIYLKSHPNDKKAKRENVDSIYEYSVLKEEFDKLKQDIGEKESSLEKDFKYVFENFSIEIIEELKNILNIKLFYFTALIFTHAKNSDLINKFAKKSGVDININSMISYFIKNYELTGNNIEWVNYLKEILKEIK